MADLKSRADIEKMRTAGRIVKKILDRMGEMCVPGATTGELEDEASTYFLKVNGGSPFLGYAPGEHKPYPAYTCISVNEEIVHGIPGRRVLKEGDIVSVDCAVEMDGWIADSAWTFPVGKISEKAQKLLQVTEECLYKGIAQARPGNRTGDMGLAVQRHAERNGFSVIRELVGHGVGRTMHEDGLQIPNFGWRNKGTVLQCGMTFAIEPMISAGRKDIITLADGWTITTQDRSLAAHFEHTVAITTDGALILTNGE